MKHSKRNLSMIDYFNIAAKEIKPQFRFNGSSTKDFINWKKQLLSKLKKLLGPMPRPVALNPQIVWEKKEDGLIKRRILLDLEKNMSAACLLYIPQATINKPTPAILCNHGHGEFGKDAVMGYMPENFSRKDEMLESIKEHNYDYGLQMAKHGYITMSSDFRGFWERGDGGNPYPGRDKCNVHFIRGSLMGVNLLALNIFDAMRCIDYLCSLKCVDKENIGAMGLSFGGTMTTWVAMLDERIKAADIICYSCMFDNFGVGRGNFCGSQYLPGLYTLCDVPDLHGLIAPKPLLAEIGKQDTCFLPEEAMRCSKHVKKIYKAAGVAKNYQTDIFEGGHQFAGNKAFAFFDKYLKKSV